jgi:dTDP-4-dehydrorhamnose reductase
MLGHKVWQVFRSRFDVFGAVRSPVGRARGLYEDAQLITGLDAAQPDSVAAVFVAAKPDAVINCVGIVKQSTTAEAVIPSLQVNALFPHRLAHLCRIGGARLVHISTDCVFSGSAGGYREEDFADATDVYGRTKYLGEVREPPALTLRTSIIGRELSSSHGLVEWFLSNRGGTVRGYRHASFSGVTTAELARLIGDVLERFPSLSGVYQVAAEPINKLDLLGLLNTAYDAGIRIEPADEPRIDRSLDGTRFRQATGWRAPSWTDMVAEMAADSTPYDTWRQA